MALGFSWGPLARSSSEDGGEETIRVVCNDEDGNSVRWLHGMGHETSGLKVPMQVKRVGIASHIAWANVANLARRWAIPTKGAMECVRPFVEVWHPRRRLESSVRVPRGGFRSVMEHVPLSEWEEIGRYVQVWTK